MAVCPDSASTCVFAARSRRSRRMLNMSQYDRISRRRILCVVILRCTLWRSGCLKSCNIKPETAAPSSNWPETMLRTILPTSWAGRKLHCRVSCRVPRRQSQRQPRSGAGAVAMKRSGRGARRGQAGPAPGASPQCPLRTAEPPRTRRAPRHRSPHTDAAAARSHQASNRPFAAGGNVSQERDHTAERCRMGPVGPAGLPRFSRRRHDP